MKRLLLIVALFAVPAHSADVDGVVLHVGSKHFAGSADPSSSCLDSAGRQEYNEFNPGVGLAGSLGVWDARWGIGAYKNSCYRTSKYALLAVPVYKSLYGVGGVVDNYPEKKGDSYRGRPIAFAGAMLRGPTHWKVTPRLIVVMNPSKDSGAKGVVELSLFTRF